MTVTRTESSEQVFAERLAELHNSGERAPTSVTWVNHWSIGQVFSACGGEALRAFSYVGVDGIALRTLLGRRSPRTSADMVLPLLLPRLRNARVCLVGGRPGVALGAGEKVGALLHGSSRLAAVVDGFDELPVTEAAIKDWVTAVKPSIVVVGLGAGLQERWALAAANVGTVPLVLTCGGFLDQVRHPAYYPQWAYPLRLNWLVRLCREPRRLWRRYTVEASRAVVRRSHLRESLLSAPGYLRYEELLCP